ncbi:uncharacterized protein BXZ73DRAFT_72868 [Epithele typhae]|uniref:uncharacterized protein n=1 Tax=Epithele typhae TaxID=378194 RepID=UPI00200778C8|nr:uncharacterized protein BXZ73DRAFT_72868 [Epithele typhae]KAH9945994.1 hypothetical protein BXZ73DRAFT_72868 [Epithele typhae]
MSNASPEVVASAEYWSSSVRFDNGWTAAALTILYYDFASTFSTEIEHFWKNARFSIASVLFVLNRYYGLLGSIPILVEFFATIPENASFFTTQSPVDTVNPLPFKFKGCDLSLTNDQSCASVECNVVFDSTVFILTLIRALQMRRYARGGLLEVLFRDGTIYYGSNHGGLRVSQYYDLCDNSRNVFLIIRGIKPRADAYNNQSNTPLKGLDTTLCNVLATTLTSRLILNLRDPKLLRPRNLGKGERLQTDKWQTTNSMPTDYDAPSFQHTLTHIEAGEVATEFMGGQGTISEISEPYVNISEIGVYATYGPLLVNDYVDTDVLSKLRNFLLHGSFMKPQWKP